LHLDISLLSYANHHQSDNGSSSKLAHYSAARQAGQASAFPDVRLMALASCQ
jgi:hypothetical protein